MPSLIELNNVHKDYVMGDQIVKALDGVNVKIEQGEFLAIIGPSGAGKSTLMDIIGLLDIPSSGTYLFNGQDVSSFNDNKRSDMRNQEIGFSFQSFFLLSNLTAIQNVSLPLTYRDMTRKDIVTQATQALQKVGLADRLHHKPNELSGGQQQRVAIARALVTNPKIILADEPTGSLDSTTSEAIIQLLQHLNQEGEVTIVIVTHNESIANRCPRTIYLKDGKIIDTKSNTKAAPAVKTKATSLRLKDTSDRDGT